MTVEAYSQVSWPMTLNKALSLNNGLNEIRFYEYWYIREIGRARKHETTQYNTAKLNQARQTMAVPLHRDKYGTWKGCE